MKRNNILKKNLFICKTPFQCIVALVLKNEYFLNEENDILLTSSINNFKILGENINKANVFKKVLYADVKKVEPKFKYALATLSPGYYMKKINLDVKNKYTHIFSNSLYGDLENAIYFFNEDAEISMFDEGYSTYTSDFLNAIEKFSFMHKLTRKLSGFFYKRRYIDENVKNIYLFDPELCVVDMPFSIKKILKNSRQLTEDITEKIRLIFQTNDAIKEYKTPVVFFEECFAEDFGNNGDLEIVEMIASLVKKENLTIKLHPRDKTNRFEKRNYKTNKSYFVPWEAIVLTMRNKPKLLFSFSSGAVLNYKFLCNQKNKTILLYKLIPNDFIKMPEERLKWFDLFVKKYGKEIYAPETQEELEEIVKGCI